jgi:lysophospholipase L1-like esterase
VAARPEQPEPFLRGCAFRAGLAVPYPRADPRDAGRLPADTWGTATIPATVRFEFVGDAAAVELDYETTTDDLGYRGDGAGRLFELWRGGEKVSSAPAGLGPGSVRLEAGNPVAGPATVYLPEGMKPLVRSLRGCGGDIEPAPRQPVWYAYGDSILEGWVASGPAWSWPAVASRRFGLDVHNFGYAGAARGEIASAEQIAALPEPAVISVSHGTNCWTRTPSSVAMMEATTAAFLDILRQAFPQTPLVVASPVLRPDAEATPNRLGATLADLRDVMQRVVSDRLAADPQLSLLPGRHLITADQLPDGIHPGDDGHDALAGAIGGAVAKALERKP